jgi:hypothetical protein
MTVVPFWLQPSLAWPSLAELFPAGCRRSVGRQGNTILDSLGNLGDFVGGIAVIATLMYLALQVRQGTETVRANSVQELTENMLRTSEILVSPEQAEMYLRGARSYSSLTPDEKLRFGLIAGPFLARFDTVLEYRERGMVDDSYVEFQAATIRLLLSNPGVREWVATSAQFQTMPQRSKSWVENEFAS